MTVFNRSTPPIFVEQSVFTIQQGVVLHPFSLSFSERKRSWGNRASGPSPHFNQSSPTCIHFLVLCLNKGFQCLKKNFFEHTHVDGLWCPFYLRYPEWAMPHLPFPCLDPFLSLRLPPPATPSNPLSHPKDSQLHWRDNCYCWIWFRLGSLLGILYSSACDSRSFFWRSFRYKGMDVQRAEFQEGGVLP